MGKNALFRSSSHINNEFNRAAYADEFVEANGIQTVMNLANSDADIDGYIAQDSFDSPYYASLYQNGQVKALNLSLNFVAEDLACYMGASYEQVVEDYMQTYSSISGFSSLFSAVVPSLSTYSSVVTFV